MSDAQHQEWLLTICDKAIDALREIGVTAARGVVGGEAAAMVTTAAATSAGLRPSSSIERVTVGSGPKLVAVESPLPSPKVDVGEDSENSDADAESSDASATDGSAPAPVRRGRGRPPKNTGVPATPAAQSAVSVFTVLDHNGRPCGQYATPETYAEQVEFLVNRAATEEIITGIVERNTPVIDGQMPRVIRDRISETAQTRIAQLSKPAADAAPALVSAPASTPAAPPAVKVEEDPFDIFAKDEKPTAEAPVEATEEMCRDAFNTLLAEKGPDSAKAIVSAFGIKKFTDLPKNKYADFFSRCQKELA